MALPEFFCAIGIPGDPIGGMESHAAGGGDSTGVTGDETAADGADPLPLPKPQAGQTGDAPGATSITVAQRGHFRRGKGTHQGRQGDHPAIPGPVL
jgi:hypothetical protein